jgi:hypothetical protein
MTDGTPDNTNGRLTGANGVRMTTADMLEFAAADALGLLDDEDRAAFDAAFASAPSAVRELVWAEQARVAEQGLELPEVSLDPAAREKFLARVRQEIERSQKSETPSRTVAHKQADRQPAPAPRNLGLRRAKRVNSLWRVATIGASVAAVALAVLQVQLRQDFDALKQRSEIASLIDAIGIEHVGDALFNDDITQRVQFTPVAAVGRAEAMLLRNPDHDRSRLYVMNLKSRTAYTLVAVDADNNPVETITAFETDDLLTGVDLDLDGVPGETVRLAIMSTDADAAVLFVAEFRLA